MWLQRDLTLRPRPRGFHLVTREVVEQLPELGELRAGLCHLFLRHTSASLTLNENASPDVREDFETWFDAVVPEGFGGWTHTLEGPDDMPAHVKASLLGPSLSLPVRDGRARPGHLAGGHPLRAPRPRRAAVAAGDAARRRAGGLGAGGQRLAQGPQLADVLGGGAAAAATAPGAASSAPSGTTPSTSTRAPPRRGAR